MSYMAIYDLAKAASFRNKLIPAIAQYAGQVMQEAATGKISRDRKRKELARRVLRDPEAASQEFVWPVLSNVTIAAAGVEATDGDILYQISEIWSTVSGVNADDEEAPVDPELPA